MIRGQQGRKHALPSAAACCKEQGGRQRKPINRRRQLLRNMWKRSDQCVSSEMVCQALTQDDRAVGSPSLSLDLDQVRDALIRMEDSIIFAIIGK